MEEMNLRFCQEVELPLKNVTSSIGQLPLSGVTFTLFPQYRRQLQEQSS
jgi:hypothetical protein